MNASVMDRRIHDLTTTYGPDYDEEFLRPTASSIERTIDVIAALVQGMRGAPPDGDIVPDGYGGVRIYLRVDEQEHVQLNIPPESSCPISMFFKGPNGKGILRFGSAVKAAS